MVPLKFAKIKCVKVCPAHPPECRVGVRDGRKSGQRGWLFFAVCNKCKMLVFMCLTLFLKRKFTT
jgi:hypothetical protein